jgi:uncharacterized protein
VVEHDEAKAFHWLMKAAEQGCPRAQYSIGEYYSDDESDGCVVERDVPKAFEWFLKAAKQGYAQAQYTVGLFYAIGGGDAGSASSFDWFLKAAEQELSEAQYAVSACYAQGDGVKQDKAKAFHWLSKAAKNGHALAQQSLRRFL